MSLPQMTILAARSLAVAQDLAGAVIPDTARMAAHIDATGGAMFAEALTFALTKKLPRPEAQAEVKNLVITAKEQGETLETMTKAAHPDLDLAPLFAPASQLGLAPDEALRFAAQARDLASSGS
jgi:3-carboxy-cis,cis-muconate cycloisomerase